MKWYSFLLFGPSRRPAQDKATGAESTTKKQPGWGGGYTKFLLYFFLFLAGFCVVMFFLSSAFIVFSMQPMLSSNMVLSVVAGVSVVGVLLLLLPFVYRLALVFPMVAADAKKASLKTAFALSKGLGWRITFCQLATQIVIYLSMALVMVVPVLAVVLTNIALGSILPAVVSIMFVIVGLLLYCFMFLCGTAAMSITVFIYMQLEPKFADRYKELSAPLPVTLDNSDETIDKGPEGEESETALIERLSAGASSDSMLLH